MVNNTAGTAKSSIRGTWHSRKHISKSLGRGAGGAPPTDAGGAGDSPASHHSDGRPLHVVGHDHRYAMGRGHVLRQLVSEGEAGRRAAPDDTKMLD